MKKTAFSFLLLAGMLLLAGCQKEGRIGGKDAIRFTAAATPGTKTAYSGVTNNTGVERIDWVEWNDQTGKGDIIRIYSDKAEHRLHSGQHWADYVIKNVTASGAQSKGKIDNVPGDGTGNGLVWGAKGEYRFTAVYPNLDCTDGAEGVIEATIPQNQAIDVTGRAPFHPDMNLAVMTAFLKTQTTVDGEGEPIQLEFTPAFTAFEFSFDSDITLDIQSFALKSTGTGTPISGPYGIKHNGSPDYSCASAEGRVINANFSSRLQVSSGHPISFVVFALPQELSGLYIEFTVKGTDWDAAQTRRLYLNYKDGTPVTFGPLAKHKISGTIQGTWCFKYITLEGKAIDWDENDIELISDKLPQATQFAVQGVKNIYDLHDQDDDFKDDRQTWVLGNKTAKVSFKVFSPLGGRYKIKPFVKKENGTIAEGNDGFIVDGTLAGPLAADKSTKVEFTVKADGAGRGDKLFFMTYVEGSDGTIYSLDSETQLFDMRGYHYFVVSE